MFGVNHETLKASDVIVSAGSCTTNSMAAMVKLLDENWGIKAGFMTTIHAYTGTQMILDGPRFPKARNNRAAAINTIPHSTGAAKAIGKVVPSVNGKLQGHAQRIQVPDGSVTELTTVLNKEVTADEINAAFKAAFSDTDFYGYNEDGIVSSDIIGDTHGGVFDPTQTDVNTVDGLTMARTVSWYDGSPFSYPKRRNGHVEGLLWAAWQRKSMRRAPVPHRPPCSWKKPEFRSKPTNTRIRTITWMTVMGLRPPPSSVSTSIRCSRR